MARDTLVARPDYEHQLIDQISTGAGACRRRRAVDVDVATEDRSACGLSRDRLEAAVVAVSAEIRRRYERNHDGLDGGRLVERERQSGESRERSVSAGRRWMPAGPAAAGGRTGNRRAAARA